MSGANYSVVTAESNDQVLVIRDDGPWDLHPTVTNDVDNVVFKLYVSRTLKNRRLFYYDSNGRYDEIVHNGRGGFLKFAPGEPLP